ncbi:MAG: hypothetical protein GXO90_09420 [FCB group bacterium]|nr:hypothetical protein [FCB group bacterium]
MNKPNNGIVVRYIPFDRPPEPLQPIVISWARESQIPDTVTILVFIHEDGDASDPSIINQTLDPELTDHISSIVTRTEFRPAIQNDHPIAAWIELPIRIQKDKLEPDR